MNKTNQFSAKAQYVTPSCKTVLLQAKDVILQGSYDGTFHTEKYSVDNDEDL